MASLWVGAPKRLATGAANPPMYQCLAFVSCIHTDHGAPTLSPPGPRKTRLWKRKCGHEIHFTASARPVIALIAQSSFQREPPPTSLHEDWFFFFLLLKPLIAAWLGLFQIQTLWRNSANVGSFWSSSQTCSHNWDSFALFFFPRRRKTTKGT